MYKCRINNSIRKDFQTVEQPSLQKQLFVWAWERDNRVLKGSLALLSLFAALRYANFAWSLYSRALSLPHWTVGILEYLLTLKTCLMGMIAFVVITRKFLVVVVTQTRPCKPKVHKTFVFQRGSKWKLWMNRYEIASEWKWFRYLRHDREKSRSQSSTFWHIREKQGFSFSHEKVEGLLGRIGASNEI